jgi:hypothetical protein
MVTGTDSWWVARRKLAPLLMAAGLVIAACGGLRPTIDPGWILHIENRTGTAVVVDISSHAGEEWDTAVRPCGSHVDIALGANGVPYEGWMIMLLLDPSGEFDTGLASWTADPHDIWANSTADPDFFPVQPTGPFIEPFWSRGGEVLPAPPLWFTITPADVLVTQVPPQPDPSASCLPIPT